MATLEQAFESVEKTHRGLGSAVALILLCVAAHKTALLIAPAGCGKSVAQSAVESALGNVMRIGSTTTVGLEQYEEELQGYSGAVFVDDMGGIDNPYARMATLTTLSELSYSGVVSKHSARAHIEIAGFRGAIVLNVQPVILKTFMKDMQWESNVQDKTLRFYHFYRPIDEVFEPPVLPEMEVPDIDKITFGVLSKKVQDELQETTTVQWSRGRARMHTSALLRAVAGYNGRTQVTNQDAELLGKILRPMRAERWLMSKEAFEGPRRFEDSLLCLMVEWATYGYFSLKNLMDDYHLGQNSAYRLMERLQRYWVPTKHKPTLYAPSPMAVWPDGETSMLHVLRDVGIITEVKK